MEVTAVCDIWKVNRERAALFAEKAHGRSPRAFIALEEMLDVVRQYLICLKTIDFSPRALQYSYPCQCS